MQLLFQEKQGFNLLWCSFLMIPLLVILAGFTYSNSSSPFILVVAWVGYILLFTVVYFSKLETRITPEGITLRFFPFLARPKHIPWSQVKQAFIREYLPLSEYGGWGAPLLHPAIYKGLGYSRAFNTKGKEGLQLILTDGRFYLIGTQKAAELQRAVEEVIKG